MNGTGFTVGRNDKRLSVADQALDKLQERVRELTLVPEATAST